MTRIQTVMATIGLVAGTSTGTAVPGVAADPVDVTCPLGAQTGSYSPGLTYTTQTVTFTSSGTLAACVSPEHPSVTGASFSSRGTGSASCSAASVSNTSTYTWNTGQTSTVTGRLAVNLKPNGITVLVLTGTVTSGQFTGATAVQTKVLLSTDVTACLTPEGLRSVSGPVSLTMAL